MKYVIAMLIGGTMISTSFIAGIVVGFDLYEYHNKRRIEKEEE